MDPSDYVINTWTSWAQAPDSVNLVAEMDGSVVGCIHGEALTASDGWLQALRVHPDAQHRGIGIQLLRIAQAALERLGVVMVRGSVAARNDPMLQLIHRAGWHTTGHIRRRRAPGRTVDAALSHPTADEAWRLLSRSPVLASRSHVSRFGRVYFSWTMAAVQEHVQQRAIVAIPNEQGLVVLDPVTSATMRARWIVGILGSPAAIHRLIDGVRSEAASQGHDVIIDSPADEIIQLALNREGFDPPDRHGDFVLVQIRGSTASGTR